MIRNYNLLSGSRDTRLKKENVTDVDISPTSFASKVKWCNFFIVPIMLLFTTFTFAQTITVPAANTNSGSVRQPLGSWFGFERSALIYTSAEIGTTGTITNVRFYQNSVSTPGAGVNVRVYMKERTTNHTAATTYATETTGATLVFGPSAIPAGSFVAGGWVNITLATPFVYSGGANNLEVIVETNATGGGNEGQFGKQFRYATQGSTALAQTWATDTTAPTGTGTLTSSRPNIQLEFLTALPPACATAFNPAAAATGVARNATLTWSAGGTSSDVYFGTTTNPPMVTNVAGNSYAPTMAANTQYFWKIVPRNANGPATGCTEQSFTTGAGFVYCLPTNSSGCSGDNISSVTLNNLSDTGMTCTPNYEDRSSVQNAIPDLPQNTTSSLNLSFGTDGTQYSRAWIDLNQNGTFESTESFSLGTNPGASSSTTIPLAIPAGALLGNTKMRIRGGNDGAILNTEACGAVASSNWGVSRDYVVNIVAPPACVAPSTLNATGLSTTGATLNWACTGCTGTFRVEYHASPATFGGVGNVVITNATSGTVISGLTQNTQYTFFVRQDCGGAGFSTVSSANFTTPSGGESCVDGPVLTVYPDAASAVNIQLTTGTTADGPAGTCSSVDPGNPNKKDRWASFVAPSNGNKIKIVTTAGTLTDAVMQVWSSCPATGTAVGCNDDPASGGLMPALELCQNQYVAGQTYYVQIWPYGATTTGNFSVKVYEEAACPLPPPNDDCAGIESISIGFAGSCPDNATAGTTVNATSTPGVVKATTCDPFGTYLDVLYTFNSGTHTDISFVFDNITGNNEFAFYDGCGTTFLGVCGAGDYSTILTGLAPNTDYTIIVWANAAADTGNFTICMSALAPPVCVASPISPANNATNVNTCAATVLSWNAVPDATTYDVYFNAGATATVLASANQAAFLGTNTYNAGVLLGSTQYSWRVIGKNSAGQATGCTDFHFTTGAAVSTPGDTFATAVNLGLLTTSLSVNGDTTCYGNDYTATSTPGSATFARATNDAFYRFEVGCNTTITAGTCVSGFDTYIHLLDSTGARVTGDDDSCVAPGNESGSVITNFAVTPGVYYVVVEGWTTAGTFTLDIANTGGACSSTVNLKLFIEGYYMGGGAMAPVADNQAGIFPPVSTDVETITVELHNTTAPYAVVASTTAMLQTDGIAVCNFPTSPSGSYYIAVLTRNAVQTWSATPQTVGSTPLTYNFSSAGTQAYDANMVEIEPGVFAFFSGDINDGSGQDGLVDPTDYSLWEADNNVFAFGSFATDLNGDGLVDPSDYSIWEANNNNFIFASYPFE